MGAEKGLIFGSMPCASWEFLRPWRDWPDLVIAADGGLSLARAAGFAPEVYIGDGDSGGRRETGLTCVELRAEKDDTDLQAAYEWARAHGLRQLIFTGCTGGRQDHHLAALGLLERARRDGVDAMLLDPQNRIEFLLPGRHWVERAGCRYFSLIPVDRTLEGLSIRGAKYCLENRTVCRGDSLTVSNEWAWGRAEIEFSSGCCYLIRSSDVVEK